MTSPLPGWAITTPPRNSTLVTTKVPLTSSGPYKFTVGARMVLDLQAGTVVLFWSKIQAADEVAYGLMYAGYLRYQFTDPTGATPPATNVQVTTAEGINILSRTHHYGIDHHLAVLVVPNTGRYTFEHVVYAGSTAYTGDTADHLILKYADQDALLMRPTDDPRWADVAEQISALQAKVAALENPTGYAPPLA